MAEDFWTDVSIKASKIFTPAAPVDEKQLFAGRIDQLRQVVDVINQKGQHAIIFGERGVGKTSLANVIAASFSGGQVITIKKNCDSTDEFSSLWQKFFAEIDMDEKKRQIGFAAISTKHFIRITDRIKGETITPEIVRQTLMLLSTELIPIIIIDEFDRISDSLVRAAVADTIKSLSDNAVEATIILVGVADSVNDLIKEHQSIERALVQIKMPRMSGEELKQIIDNGLKMLGMTIDEDARKHITILSQGLPHYTHLLALHSARKAIDVESKNIDLSHVEAAISKALQQAQQTTKSSYHRAIMSPRKDNIFSQVLLACALARTDDMGFFAAADIRDPLSKIMHKNYEIPSFSRHLNDFCESKRGAILQKIGTKRRYRFRFARSCQDLFAKWGHRKPLQLAA